MHGDNSSKGRRRHLTLQCGPQPFLQKDNKYHARSSHVFRSSALTGDANWYERSSMGMIYASF